MLDYRLIKLMQVLQSKELLDIEKYLAVPFINSNDDVSKLFTQLCKFHPRFDSPKLTKERLFQKLFGKQPYNDGKMRKMMMLLSQVIEQYLMQKELKKSEELQAKLLSMSLRDRNNYELFLQTVDTRLKKLEKGSDRGRNYFRESFELNEMVFFHPGSDKISNRNEYLYRSINNFESYFTLVTLQVEANNIVRNRLEREQSFSPYLDMVIQVVEKQKADSPSAIRFFYQLVLLLKDQTEENMEYLKHNAFKTFVELNRFEQDFALNLLRSYAVPMANKGSLLHRRFVLDLYKLELERGFLADTISAVAFMNIVASGLGLDDLDWVENFIGEYHQYLPPDEKEMTLYYSKGILFYHKGLKYNQIEYFYSALQNLTMIPTRAGAKFEIRLRPLILRIHFEIFERRMESLEEILMHAKNFERHLIGSEVYAGSIQDSYLNFVRFFRTIARLADNPNKSIERVQAIKDSLIKKEEDIALKQWLLDKIDRLALND